MSLIKSIAKSIYFKLLINIPEPRVLGNVFFAFSPKLIESHNSFGDEFLLIVIYLWHSYMFIGPCNIQDRALCLTGNQPLSNVTISVI